MHVRIRGFGGGGGIEECNDSLKVDVIWFKTVSNIVARVKNFASLQYAFLFQPS